MDVLLLTTRQLKYEKQIQRTISGCTTLNDRHVRRHIEHWKDLLPRYFPQLHEEVIHFFFVVKRGKIQLKLIANG